MFLPDVNFWLALAFESHFHLIWTCSWEFRGLGLQGQDRPQGW